MSTYVIELGLDLNATLAVLGQHPGAFYLPAGITEFVAGRRVVSTYNQLKSANPEGNIEGDEIDALIYDISMISSTPSETEPNLLDLNFSFKRARRQTDQNPFDDHNIPYSSYFGSRTDRESIIFGRVLPSYEVTFKGNKQTLVISKSGFFTATYTMRVESQGETRTYVHDPEWIVDPF